MTYTPSPILVLSNIIIIVYMLISKRKVYYRALYPHKNRNYFLLSLCLLFFSVFAFSQADTYHYHQLFDDMVSYKISIHVEPFYYWLIENVTHNYYIWRFLIWGSATWFIIASFKKIDLDSDTLTFLSALTLMSAFSLSREALPMTMIIYAISTFYKKNGIINILWAIICLGVAIFLHKSIILFEFFLIVGLLPLNKRIIFVSILFFPILYGSIKVAMQSLLTSGLLSGQTAAFAKIYFDLENEDLNLLGMVYWFFSNIPIVCLLFLCIKKYTILKQSIKPVQIFFLKYSYWLIYVSFLFLGQEMSSFISSRASHAAMFTITIVGSDYLYLSKRNKKEKREILFLILGVAYVFLYYFYKSL